MARSVAVPQYTSSTQQSGSDKRTLTSSAPSGESTVTGTTNNGVLQSIEGYLRPESTFADDNEDPLAVGTAKGRGWAMATLDADNAHTIAAGTWTVVVHYSRPGGLVTANRPAQFTAILFSANASLDAFPAEIGRVTGSQVTLTTSEQTQTLNISGAQTQFAAGDRVWLEIHMLLPLQTVAADTGRIHTNSSTATRITAAPTYTTQYSRGMADDAPATDTVARLVNYARPLADSAPATDVLARVVTMPRTLADAAPCADDLTRLATYFRALVDSAPTSDVLTRQVAMGRALSDHAPAADSLTRQASYTRALADDATVADSLTRDAEYHRALADNVPCVDALTRQAVYARALEDSAALVDALTRGASYTRALDDSVAAVGDTLTRVVTANRALSDSAPCDDTLTRAAEYHRALADSAEVADALTRQMLYARALQETLSEGGGTVIRPIYVFDD